MAEAGVVSPDQVKPQFNQQQQSPVVLDLHMPASNMVVVAAEAVV
jgi:hypothetical protein